MNFTTMRYHCISTGISLKKFKNILSISNAREAVEQLEFSEFALKMWNGTATWEKDLAVSCEAH